MKSASLSLVAVIATASIGAPAAASGGTEVEHAGVRVEVEVSSQDFTYRVTNVDAAPITRFEVDVHHTYNHQGPDGWTVEYDTGHLLATADRARFGIAPGRSVQFLARVASVGATMGQVPAIVGFDGDDEPVELLVWGPVAQPKPYIATIVFTLIGIAVVHTGLVRLRAAR